MYAVANYVVILLLLSITSYDPTGCPVQDHIKGSSGAVASNRVHPKHAFRFVYEGEVVLSVCASLTILVLTTVRGDSIIPTVVLWQRDSRELT